MSINLEKGQRIKIGLQQIGVGLGWDPNNTGNGTDFDLDASVFMLGDDKKLPADEFFVFYNNQESPDGAVVSSGDDLTGGNSDGGDDESLTIDLSMLKSSSRSYLAISSFALRPPLSLGDFTCAVVNGNLRPLVMATMVA